MFNRMLKCAATLAVCLPTLALAQTPAARRDGAWEFSLGAGVITIDRAFAASVLVPMGIQDARPSRIAPGIAGRVGYQFNRNIGLSFGTMVGSGSGATIISPFFALTASTDINQKMSPFATLGFGISRFSTGSSAVFTPPRAVHETASYGAHFGLGVRHMISERVAVRLEGRMQYEQFEELDSVSGNPAYNGFATLGLSYFTHGRRMRDADGDGVEDRNDRCANTPRGARVDQNGCPLDSDRDGVPDGLDRCPNTPANMPVDANGCPRDTDSDGVADNIDRCPNTPANTRVDANGCPLVADADADGVGDSLDRCPNTPAGTRVDANGCPRDTDGDGVADNLDRCPNTPAGALVDANGCPRDADGDGVTDNLDRCANTPPNTRVDANGCPAVPDQDQDGVPDSRDRCPNTPTGRAVDSVGCPLFALPGMDDQLILRVQFITNTSTLTGPSRAHLDSVALAIIATPGSNWEVQGHTDSRGSAQLNARLSQSRAQSVADYLVSKGVPRGSMEAIGFGPSRPIQPNTTAAGQAANRRVQLRRKAAPNPNPLP